MKFRFIVVFFFLFTFLFGASKINALGRYASCDLCGLCQEAGVVQPTPQSWESCRKCLYPTAGADPLYTVLVNPTTNLAPTTYPGHQYTMIGCIGTNLSGFSSPGGAAGPTQIILNLIFSLAAGVSLIYFLYGSYTILTSQSDVERLNYGKRIVTASILGLVFTLSSIFIINTIASSILKIPGFGGLTPTPTP